MNRAEILDQFSKLLDVMDELREREESGRKLGLTEGVARLKGSGGRVLIVDDDPHIREVLVFAFDKAGIATTQAGDGEEALAFFARWEAGEALPAVILLDINLPRVNGLEVLQKLKQHPEFRRIPVVVLTSSRDDRDLKSAYDLGVNSYIEKPVSFNKFIEVAEHIELYWCVFNERPY